MATVGQWKVEGEDKWLIKGKLDELGPTPATDCEIKFAKRIEELEKEVAADDREFVLIAQELGAPEHTRESIMKTIREIKIKLGTIK